MNADTTNRFLNAAVRLGVYSNRQNLERHLSYLFGGVDLRHKHLLDVGGGAGLLTLYAATRGASAVCVEPESEGSTGGITKKFLQLRNAVDPELPAELVVGRIESYLSVRRHFDVVIIANAINHLNEEACIRLLDDRSAQADYEALFRSLCAALNPGGCLIATDCSKSNFFNDIGAKSPFMPDIEWRKHQAPATWDRLLQRAGFLPARVQWSSPNTLGSFGRFVLGNRLAAYFLLSHFRLVARKPLTPVS
jgi:SAM-dependent methyltransferase